MYFNDQEPISFEFPLFIPSRAGFILLIATPVPVYLSGVLGLDNAVRNSPFSMRLNSPVLVNDFINACL